MPVQQKQKAKGRKIGRNKKHQALTYRSMGRLEKNRKRRMRRHIRDNPHDKQNRKAFELTCGALDSIGLSCRGKKLVKRAKRAQRVAA